MTTTDEELEEIYDLAEKLNQVGDGHIRSVVIDASLRAVAAVIVEASTTEAEADLIAADFGKKLKVAIHRYWETSPRNMH